MQSGKYVVYKKLGMVSTFFFFSLLCTSLNARQLQKDTIENTNPADSLLVVRNIYITGNKKTKEFVILREMQIKPGDSIRPGRIEAEMEAAKVFIYNTTLFSEVDVYPLVLNPHQMDIIISVKEKWYILPIPHLELADRSFNEWVKTYNADLRRLSYGIQFSHMNFSGRRDQLSVTLINGFKRNIALEYHAPYINSALTKGLKAGIGLSQTREIPYSTDEGNKLLYYENGGYEKSEWNASLAYTFRKGLKRKGTFTAAFRHISVSDSVVKKYNPNFFKGNSNTHDFLELGYDFTYENVDNVLYPLSGNEFYFSVLKRGLAFKGSVNSLSIAPSYNSYFSLGKDWYTSIRLHTEIKLPFDQPYFNLRALGYGENYLRGYEYYVIDGVFFGLAKLDVKKKIARFSLPTIIHTKIIDKIPVSIFAKTFADAGYAYDKSRSLLGNRFLYSGGIGIDIITLFDLKVSVEYSMNQLGQKGLFLH